MRKAARFVLRARTSYPVTLDLVVAALPARHVHGLYGWLPVVDRSQGRKTEPDNLLEC